MKAARMSLSLKSAAGKAAVFAVSLFLLTLLGSVKPQAQSSLTPALEAVFVAGELIVEINSEVSIAVINQRHRTQTLENLRGTNFYRLQIPAGKSEKKWRKRLAHDPDVLLAVRNPLVHNPFTTNGRSVMTYPDAQPRLPHTAAEYLLQRQIAETLKPEDLHLRSQGAGIVVAVIDTGVDRAHPALASHMWKEAREVADGRDNENDGFIDDSEGWDFVDNDNDPSEHFEDPDTTVAGHGTFVAGLIALLAPEAKIMPLRAFTATGRSDVFRVAAAVKFAADHGADVINLSCGSTENSSVLHKAIQYARERNVFIVAAAGNQQTDTPLYPAALGEEVVGVGAVDGADRRAYFSNFGVNVTLNTLGVNLISAFPGERYAAWNGTSFAAPLAAAAAALLLAEEPNRANVRTILEETALNLDALNPDFARRLGKGRLDTLAALQYLVTLPALDLYAQIELQVRQPQTTAHGVAAIYTVGDYQAFTLEAHGLEARAAYRLYVDGAALNDKSLFSDEFGGLKIEFTTAPEKAQLPLPETLKPVTKIQRVALHDAGNRLVLENQFAAVGDVAPPGLYFAKQAQLTTLASPRFIGTAMVQVYGEFSSLEVKAERLLTEQIYQVVVDGVELGAFVTQSDLLEVTLTSEATNGIALPPRLRPIANIRRVEVFDALGRRVLQGEFKFSGGVIGAPPASDEQGTQVR